MSFFKKLINLNFSVALIVLLVSFSSYGYTEIQNRNSITTELVIETAKENTLDFVYTSSFETSKKNNRFAFYDFHFKNLLTQKQNLVLIVYKKQHSNYLKIKKDNAFFTYLKAIQTNAILHHIC